jgi:hypothetical protein
MSLQPASADPLLAQAQPERAAYATGVLLDAQDFTDEQTYHRGRLARALGGLAGGGTLAGLRVAHRPAGSAGPEELEVAAGLGLCPLGRLIEVQRPACLRLQPWYERALRLESSVLQRAAYANLGRFASPRAIAEALALPQRAVVADVFVRFATCAVGLTPSFANGPFDSLNATSTSRLRDAYQLRLVARTGLDDDFNGLPLPLPARPANADARRAALQDQVLNAWPVSPTPASAPPQALDDLDDTETHLARVFIPVDASNPPQRTAAAPVVDNYGRRFLPTLALLGHWA